jgi:hypothetical protein
MRTILLIGLLAVGAAHAQVHKCKGADGRTVYSDAPCPGGQLLDPAQLRGNTVAPVEVPRPAPAQERAAAPAAPVAARPSCLSAQEVKNMETSAGSITLDAVEREVRLQDIVRAQRCQPLMTEAEKELLREQIKRANRTARQARPATVTACDGGGCNDSNGRRYIASGGVLIRDDGTVCTRAGAMLNCP